MTWPHVDPPVCRFVQVVFVQLQVAIAIKSRVLRADLHVMRVVSRVDAISAWLTRMVGCDTLLGCGT
jgi:hypothetical protein